MFDSTREREREWLLANTVTTRFGAQELGEKQKVSRGMYRLEKVLTLVFSFSGTEEFMLRLAKGVPFCLLAEWKQGEKESRLMPSRSGPASPMSGASSFPESGALQDVLPG